MSTVEVGREAVSPLTKDARRGAASTTDCRREVGPEYTAGWGWHPRIVKIERRPGTVG